MFDGMVQDAFDRIDILKGKTLSDISSVTILAHSAGYNPAKAQLYNNAIAERIQNLVLLDALYDRTGFDRWLKTNARALGSGQKRFYNIFYGTETYSKQQAQTLKRELSAVGSKTPVVEDYDDGEQVLDRSAFATTSMLFKYSSARVSGLHPHFAIVNLYVAPVVSALS
jgi:hypothetical protein